MFAFEEVVVKFSGVYSCDRSMGVIALKVDFSISCFKYLLQNNKHGSNNDIGIIRLEFFTMEIVCCEEMLLKSSGLYHFEGSIDGLFMTT